MRQHWAVGKTPYRGAVHPLDYGPAEPKKCAEWRGDKKPRISQNKPSVITQIKKSHHREERSGEAQVRNRQLANKANIEEQTYEHAQPHISITSREE